MQQKRDLAIVLRSIPYEERHRIVTALTENHGQVSALARNSIQSRRFGGTLEQFCASEWHFAEKPGSELARLDQALVKRPFEGLRKDFEKLSLASVFSELMLKLAPRNEACADLFRLHSNALATLEEQPAAPSLVLLNGYMAKLLQWSGNQPRLQGCHLCAKPLNQMDDDASLSCLIADAAWLCPDCRASGTQSIRHQHRISPLAVVDCLTSLVSPIRQLQSHARASEADHRELFHFIEALFAYHMPGFDQKPLNGLRFLGLESNLPPPAANPR